MRVRRGRRGRKGKRKNDRNSYCIPTVEEERRLLTESRFVSYALLTDSSSRETRKHNEANRVEKKKNKTPRDKTERMKTERQNKREVPRFDD